jgi:hypothetical protein
MAGVFSGMEWIHRGHVRGFLAQKAFRSYAYRRRLEPTLCRCIVWSRRGFKALQAVGGEIANRIRPFQLGCDAGQVRLDRPE